MDITNITLLISVPLQCIAMLWINAFWLDYKVSKRGIAIFVVGVLLPTMILFSLVDALISFYWMFALIFFLYKKTRKKIVILNVLASFLIAVIIDHIVSLIFILFFPAFFAEIIFIILRILLFGLLLTAVAFMYKKLLYYLLDKYMIFKKIFYLLIGLLLISLLFFYLNIFMMADKNSLDNIQFNLWIFSIYFIFILIISASIIFLSIKQHKISLREKEYDAFLNYTTLLEQNISDIRKFKHDYINILSSLRYYIDNDDLNGLKHFFHENIIPTQQFETHSNYALDQLHNLKVEGLKGLLTTKIIYAQENGIPIYLEIVEEITSIQLDIIELNRIVSILLDNAIEASKITKDPVIRIAFITLDTSKVIVILNKVDEKTTINVQDIFREGYSTKGDNRGVGLPNLKKVLHANNQIILNTKVGQGYFTQEIEIKDEGVW